MKRVSVFFLIMIVATSMTWVAGCRSPEAPSSGTDDLLTRDENPDFNDAYGGYNMKDEEPGFGEASLLDEFGEDEDYADPYASDRDVADLERSQRERVFLKITWGNLHRDSTIEHVTNWAGSLTVDPGIILLKKVIRFERATDRILPRVSRDLLEWESVTRPHLDGILVRILPTPVVSVTDTMIDSSATVITFDTAPLTVDFTLADLPGLNRVITLPDGNAVAFQAIRLAPSDCPHGFLGGVWANHPERQGGFFFGMWSTEDGLIMGHLRGIYGVNDEGRQVFFGKMISRNGRFVGIMRGEWGVAGNDPNAGWFAGHWVGRNRDIKGGLKGEWRRSDRCHGGFFRGMWAAACD